MTQVSPSDSISGGLCGWMDNSGHQPTLQHAHQLLRPRALVTDILRARATSCSSGRSPLGPRAQGRPSDMLVKVEPISATQGRGPGFLTLSKGASIMYPLGFIRMDGDGLY
jgi:hypothetical protein